MDFRAPLLQQPEPLRHLLWTTHLPTSKKQVHGLKGSDQEVKSLR